MGSTGLAATASSLGSSSSNCTQSAEAMAACLSNVIINPIIALIFAAGLLVFIYGIIEYLWGLSSDASGKEHGKMHMLWGIVGMFIMVSAYAILNIITNTLNTIQH